MQMEVVPLVLLVFAADGVGPGEFVVNDCPCNVILPESGTCNLPADCDDLKVTLNSSIEGSCLWRWQPDDSSSFIPLPDMVESDSRFVTMSVESDIVGKVNHKFTITCISVSGNGVLGSLTIILPAPSTTALLEPSQPTTRTGDPSVPSQGNPSSTPSPPTEGAQPPDTGAIIGGMTAGVIILGLVGLFVALCVFKWRTIADTARNLKGGGIPCTNPDCGGLAVYVKQPTCFRECMERLTDTPPTETTEENNEDPQFALTPVPAEEETRGVSAVQNGNVVQQRSSWRKSARGNEEGSNSADRDTSTEHSSANSSPAQFQCDSGDPELL